MEHPSFQKVLQLTTRAGTNGINIPSCKINRHAIISCFQENMKKLRQTFSVSAINDITRFINDTCNRVKPFKGMST